MTPDMAISAQRGQIVNPARSTDYAVQREVVNPATETTNREKVFLFSAITQPGNSGGPIAAGDGRVIGLVVEDSVEATSSYTGPDSAPFYRGILSSQVIHALDIGFGGIIKTEREPKQVEVNRSPQAAARNRRSAGIIRKAVTRITRIVVARLLLVTQTQGVGFAHFRG